MQSEMNQTPLPKGHDLHLPAHGDSPVLFAAGHSGRYYPPDFLAQVRLNPLQIRASEDAYVDQLFGAAPALGAKLLVARYPRAYLDLNRAAHDLDPALIADLPRRVAGLNLRVISGLGVIPRVVGPGKPIYSGKIPYAEAAARLSHLWQPYHAALAGQMLAAQRQYGRAILFDCHSMPADAVGLGGPDIVLGDRHGRAADVALRNQTIAAFRAQGFRVAVNHPFAGAYVTETYGRPADGWHAIQIEVNRALYLDEAQVVPHGGFVPLQARLTRVMAQLIGTDHARIAAE